MSDERTPEERLQGARETLTGERETHGLLRWFRGEIESRTGWKPADSTVHGWIRRGVEMPEPARKVMEELEAEARAELERKLKELR